MDRDKTYYNQRIEICERVKAQLHQEIRLIEEQISSSQMLLEEIVSEIGAVDNDTRTITDGRRIFPLGDVTNGERNYYAGSWLVNPEGTRYCRIEQGGNDGFIVDKSVRFEDVARDFLVGGDFLIYDAGPGDIVRIVTVAQKDF